MGSGIGDLAATLSMDSNRFTGGLHDAGHALHGFKDIFLEVGAALGVGFSLDKMVEGVRGSIDTIVELSHASEKLDMPIGKLQALRHEAMMNHVEFVCSKRA